MLVARNAPLSSCWLALVLLTACAKPAVESATPEWTPAQTAALERRIAADLRWRPGDAEPSSRELARPDPPVGAKSTPILWSTVIRNRCNAAARITVGPADLAPGAVTVNATLAADEAINVGLTSEDWVHLQAADGTYHHRAQAAGGFLIITGDSECDEIVGLAR